MAVKSLNEKYIAMIVILLLAVMFLFGGSKPAEMPVASPVSQPSVNTGVVFLFKEPYILEQKQPEKASGIVDITILPPK